MIGKREFKRLAQRKYTLPNKISDKYAEELALLTDDLQLLSFSSDNDPKKIDYKQQHEKHEKRKRKLHQQLQEKKQQLDDAVEVYATFYLMGNFQDGLSELLKDPDFKLDIPGISSTLLTEELPHSLKAPDHTKAYAIILGNRLKDEFDNFKELSVEYTRLNSKPAHVKYGSLKVFVGTFLNYLTEQHKQQLLLLNGSHAKATKLKEMLPIISANYLNGTSNVDDSARLKVKVAQVNARYERTLTTILMGFSYMVNLPNGDHSVQGLISSVKETDPKLAGLLKSYELNVTEYINPYVKQLNKRGAIINAK